MAGGSDRVKRGGGFDDDASNLRASNRDDDDPSDADDDLGFRCSSPRVSARRAASTDAVPVPKVP